MLQLEKNGICMTQDKRKAPRRASLNRCIVEKCFSENEVINSRSINYSERGCMLSMDYPMSPGDAITLEFDSDAEETKMYGRSVCLGMVRWCKPQDGSCCGFYGVGVELVSQTPRRRVY